MHFTVLNIRDIIFSKLGKQEGFPMTFELFPKDKSKNKDFVIKDFYSGWRDFNQKSKQPFIMLFSSFKDHLKDLDGGALKLYLFFSFAAKNDDGHSFHSITSIADYFGVQTRTIDKWVKTLSEKGLIYREKNDYRSSTTYLLPYSTSLIKARLGKHVYSADNQQLLDDLINVLQSNSEIFGDVIGVFHLFQWNTDEENERESSQCLLIITKRANGVLTGHYFPLHHSEHLSIDKEGVNGDTIHFFESPFNYQGELVLGIALHDGDELEKTTNKKALQDLKGLIENLGDEDFDESMVNNDLFVSYGEKKEFFGI